MNQIKFCFYDSKIGKRNAAFNKTNQISYVSDKLIKKSSKYFIVLSDFSDYFALWFVVFIVLKFDQNVYWGIAQQTIVTRPVPPGTPPIWPVAVAG